MGRPLTWAIAGAIALIAAFALADGFRADGPRSAIAPRAERSPTVPADGPPRIEGATQLALTLRRNGVAGALFLMDERCRLWTLLLPEVEYLTPTANGQPSCTFSASENGRQVIFGARAVWQPHGGLVAQCRRGAIVVFARRTRSPSFVIGSACAPAWKPNGRLTYVRSGQVWERRREGRVVIGRRELEAAARAASSEFRHFYAPAAKQVDWLSNSRAVVLLRMRVREQEGSRPELLAIFERGRLVGVPHVNLRYEDLRLSPRRTYVTARGRAPRGLIFLDAAGDTLALNPIATGRRVSWSSDEAWTAVASQGSTIFLFRSGDIGRFASDDRPRTLRIPLYTVDLAWR
jgi:hypothetical protein